MKCAEREILTALLGIITVCVQVSECSRLNSKVTSKFIDQTNLCIYLFFFFVSWQGEISADTQGETCPLGKGLMLCPPDHQTWTCFCPTQNESIAINCAAIDENTFCPEPLVSRIGVSKFTQTSLFKWTNAQQIYKSKLKHVKFYRLPKTGVMQWLCEPAMQQQQRNKNLRLQVILHKSKMQQKYRNLDSFGQ